jgi:hypothetical protein
MLKFFRFSRLRDPGNRGPARVRLSSSHETAGERAGSKEGERTMFTMMLGTVATIAVSMLIGLQKLQRW